MRRGNQLRKSKDIYAKYMKELAGKNSVLF